MATADRHLQISQLLGGRIARGELRPGDHLPPEPELARQLGVSRFSLRKALDSLASQGRVVRQRGLGTRVADYGGTGPSGSGALISYLGETDTHIYADLFLALTKASQAAGMRMQVLEPEHAASYRPLVRHDGRDVINHLVCAGASDTIIKSLASDPQAIRVAIGLRNNRASGFDYAVHADDGDALHLAVARLALLGHQRIALVTSAYSEPTLPLPNFYRSAVNSAGLKWQRIIACTGSDVDWAEQVTIQLRTGERPTAIVCDMDYMAVHIFDAAKALNLHIPDALSVIGMYDTPWSQVLRPQLATIAFPLDLIARLAIGCLTTGRPAVTRRVSVQGTLLERASIAPPSR